MLLRGVARHRRHDAPLRRWFGDDLSCAPSVCTSLRARRQRQRVMTAAAVAVTQPCAPATSTLLRLLAVALCVATLCAGRRTFLLARRFKRLSPRLGARRCMLPTRVTAIAIASCRWLRTRKRPRNGCCPPPEQRAWQAAVA